MAEEPTQEAVSWEWRYGLGVLVLGFNAACICWLMVYGRSENLLHQNALSWSYILSAGVLAGLGLGAVIPQLTQIMGKK